jgi:hypothetical protein
LTDPVSPCLLSEVEDPVKKFESGRINVKAAKPLSGDPSNVQGIISGSGLATDIACRKIHNIIMKPDPILVIPVDGFK